MLKADWEKANETTSIDEQTIRAMIGLSLPDRTLHSYKIIAGGCANLNIKLSFENQHPPLILRIYVRDQEAALREQKIAQLAQGKIPVPKILCVGSYQSYRYALVEYVEGQTLRDAILEGQDTDKAVYAAGKFLGKLQQISFPHAGFFDDELNLRAPLAADGYREFLLNSLENSMVQAQLEQGMIERITWMVTQYAAFFPSDRDHHLVHADYDPSNILVIELNGIWKITAILDWEFAFSGSYMCDMANMLRYAHKLPASYREKFLEGVKDSGINLPERWQISINLLNLLSLLDCLVHADPVGRPRQCADIKELVEHIVKELELT